MSGVNQAEVFMNLPDRKGLISKQELLGEMKAVQASMIKTAS